RLQIICSSSEPAKSLCPTPTQVPDPARMGTELPRESVANEWAVPATWPSTYSVMLLPWRTKATWCQAPSATERVEAMLTSLDSSCQKEVVIRPSEVTSLRTNSQKLLGPQTSRLLNTS